MTLPPGLPAVREEDDCFVRKRGIFAIAVASAVLAGCGGDNEVERQVKQRLGPGSTADCHSGEDDPHWWACDVMTGDYVTVCVLTTGARQKILHAEGLLDDEGISDGACDRIERRP